MEGIFGFPPTGCVIVFPPIRFSFRLILLFPPNCFYPFSTVTTIVTIIPAIIIPANLFSASPATHNSLARFPAAIASAHASPRNHVTAMIAGKPRISATAPTPPPLPPNSRQFPPNTSPPPTTPRESRHPRGDAKSPPKLYPVKRPITERDGKRREKCTR